MPVLLERHPNPRTGMLRTMRFLSKRLGLALAVVAVAITLGVVLSVWPRHLRVMNQDGSLLCTISRGWSLHDVATACGAPAKRSAKGRPDFGTFLFCPM